MARVAVVFTGGTISMAVDAAAGGNVPVLDGAGDPRPDAGARRDRGRRRHRSRTDARQPLHVRGAARDRGRPPRRAGAIHRSTALSSSRAPTRSRRRAFFWDLVLDGAKPVVVTGAMRASDEPGYDGPANLRDAVRVAAAPSMRGAGVVVVLAGTIEPADDVIKIHASALDTFGSPNGGSPRARGWLGRDRLPASGGSAARSTRLVRRSGCISSPPRSRWMGRCSTRPWRPVRMGSSSLRPVPGNTDPALLAAAERAMATGIPVALASRCIAGRAGTAYAFPGGGATWVKAGALPVGNLCAVKARVGPRARSWAPGLDPRRAGRPPGRPATLTTCRSTP